MPKKYAVIIGASRGIGQAVAVTLARSGYETILIGRSKAGLEETAAICEKSSTSHIVIGDITIQLPKILSRIKKLTSKLHFVWLGSAGYSDDPLSQTPRESIREFIRSGYEALVEFTGLAYPMLRAGRAHVVGACSDWSDFHSGGPSLFGSTKVALAGFLDKFRDEAKKDQISVTSLKMGNVGNLEGFGLDDVERQKRKTGRRMVALRDVCDAIEFIISRKTGMVSELTLIPGE